MKKKIIYGAGRYASVVYRDLWMNGEKDAIWFFAVTNKVEQEQKLYGIPVKQFADIEQECINAEVIIAVKDADEIESMLRHAGVIYIERITSKDIENMRNQWNHYLKQIPVQRNKVFFSCFGGKGYECNCKYIAEKLLEEQKPVEIVWKVEKENLYSFPSGIRQVTDNTPEYEIELCSAGVIVSNMENAPCFKNKMSYHINTWHGTGPFKKARASVAVNGNNPEWMKREREDMLRTDLCISNSSDNTYMFRKSFLYHGEILECGNPRNDILFENNGDIRKKVCDILNIDVDMKILFYAPTFRENVDSTFETYTLDMQKVLCTFKERFGEEFILLYRFHQKLRDYANFSDFYPFGVNVTDYPDVMELVVAADVLITDYSSIMWDFSLQHRPVFLYHNDVREYTNDRDFYWPISKWPYVVAHTSEEMCEKILSFDEKEYLSRLEHFFEEDPSYDDGHASGRVVERIMDVIEHPEKYGKM